MKPIHKQPLVRLIGVLGVGLLLASGLLFSATSLLAQRITIPETILDISWHPHGTIYAQVQANGTVTVRDGQSGQSVFTYPSSLSPRIRARIDWNAAGTRLAVGAGNRVIVWSYPSWQEIDQYQAGNPNDMASVEGINYAETIYVLSWATYNSSNDFCSPTGQVFTNYQQNPSPYAPEPERTIAEIQDQEAAADMFLNWVYRKLEVGGFLNRDWRPQVTDVPSQLPCNEIPTGCDNTTAASGDARYVWMQSVMNDIFFNRGWN